MTNHCHLIVQQTRQQVADVRSVVRELATPLSFDPEVAFKSPIKAQPEKDQIGELFGTVEFHAISLPRTTPRPVATGVTRVDEVIERGLKVVDAVFEVLANSGSTMGEAFARQWGPGETHADDAGVEQAVLQAATDWWPLSTTAAFHRFADDEREGRGRPGLVEEVDAWLDSFESKVPIAVSIERLVDVLSMPNWGKRHELYAAWIATQFNQALPTDRLDFVVVNQTLRFPFKATRLATLQAADGVHELWCEIRSDLLDAFGARVRGIQPDYRVLRRDRSGQVTTVLAVEVKQYRGAAARKHGKVLAMYAAGLSDANVFLVGHGPIGDAQTHVPQTERHRTKVFEHVRPGRIAESATFRTAIAALLPPPRLPERMELAWNVNIRDLDLHLRIDGEMINWQSPSGKGGSLRADAFHGGPEVIDLATDLTAPIDVEVHLYSTEVTSVLAAQPRVMIIWVGGEATELRPTMYLQTGDPRRWAVCRVERDGTVTPYGGTEVVP